MLTIYSIYLFIINLFTFVLYGVDKYKSKKKKWRIKESTLLCCSAIGGALGASIGMNLFHHKTLHTQFRILVPICLFIWTFVSCLLFYYVK